MHESAHTICGLFKSALSGDVKPVQKTVLLL